MIASEQVDNRLVRVTKMLVFSHPQYRAIEKESHSKETNYNSNNLTQVQMSFSFTKTNSNKNKALKTLSLTTSHELNSSRG